MDTSYNTGQSKLSPLEVLGNQYRPIGLGINEYTEQNGYSSEEKLNKPEDKIAVTPQDINLRNQGIATNKFNEKNKYSSKEKATQTNDKIAVTPEDINVRIQGLASNFYNSNKKYPDFK